MFAVSLKNVTPTRYVTWFQAVAACRASGKRLLTAEEWFVAGQGTNDDVNTTCNVSGADVRVTGQGAACVSRWGAQDMIGNLWEWTSEWYAATANPGTADGTAKWGASYNGDGVWGVTGTVDSGSGITAIPAAALRGGGWDLGPSAGLFALDLNLAPSDWSPLFGFRCAIGR
jgi:formylglycine-generating enzyme required for sulfatase activity